MDVIQRDILAGLQQRGAITRDSAFNRASGGLTVGECRILRLSRRRNDRATAGD